MNLAPTTVSIPKQGDDIKATIHGQPTPVDRLARAFPKSNPDQFVSLIDHLGHEIGIIEDPKKLDEDSRNLLEAELKEIYFIPTIQAVKSVEPKGTGSQWIVDTDDGEYTFRILGREAINGDEPPSLEITSETGKKYRIENFWELDADSRDLTQDLLPDKVIKARYYAKSMSSGRGKGSGSRSGGSRSGGSRSSGGLVMSMR